MGLTFCFSGSATDWTAGDLSIATEQNSSNCQEENCTFSVADNYFNFQSIYSLCQEEAENMGFKKGNIAWNKGLRGIQKGYWTNKKHSDVTKNKISESKKGSVPWNKGKKGLHLSPETEFNKGKTPWNKNKKMSDDYCKKNSDSHKGLPSPNKGKKGQIPWNKGKKTGCIPWNKGMHLSKEQKLQMSGSNHVNWKGGRKIVKARVKSRRNKRGFELILLKNPYNEPIDYHHIHPDLPYVVPCPTRIHRMFLGEKTHFQNVNAMLGIVGVEA